MTAVTPLQDLARRIPIAGKLRAGQFTGGRPKAIDTWRLTTSSREFADNFAQRYGGNVAPMTNKNSPHTWEVVSETDEVAIALINDGYSVAYELWSGGGCQRRCDGVTAEVIQTTGPDDVEYVPNPCICDRKQELECSLKSRLTMILPDLPFRGGVVYETGSKNFAEESQGMLALLSQMQQSGVTKGVLRLEQRRSSGGRRFTIAVVGVSASPEAIVSGMSGMRSLGRAEESRPEISAPPLVEGADGGSGPSQEVGSRDTGPPPSSGVDGAGEGPSTSEEPTSCCEYGNFGDNHNCRKQPPEEDIVDAEIIDDGPDETPPRDDHPQEGFVLEPAERARMRRAFMARVDGMGLSYDDQVKPWVASKYGVGGWSDLDDSQAWGLYHALVVPDGSRQEKEDAERRFRVAVEEHAEATE